MAVFGPPFFISARYLLRLYLKLITSFCVHTNEWLLPSNESQYNFKAMAEKKKGIGRTILHAGGWQVAKRVAKTIPFGGTAVVLFLVGSDIRKKGVVGGLINSGIDAIPFVGLAKNAVELVRGDFIRDKEVKNGKR